MADDSAIFEIRQIGSAIKITAIDPQTMIEVSLQAPATTPKIALQRLAMAKLARALERADRPA